MAKKSDARAHERTVDPELKCPHAECYWSVPPSYAMTPFLVNLWKTSRNPKFHPNSAKEHASLCDEDCFECFARFGMTAKEKLVRDFAVDNNVPMSQELCIPLSSRAQRSLNSAASPSSTQLDSSSTLFASSPAASSSASSSASNSTSTTYSYPKTPSSTSSRSSNRGRNSSKSPASASSSSSTAVATEKINKLRSFLHGLPQGNPTKKLLIQALHVDGVPIREHAELFGIPKSTYSDSLGGGVSRGGTSRSSSSSPDSSPAAQTESTAATEPLQLSSPCKRTYDSFLGSQHSRPRKRSEALVVAQQFWYVHTKADHRIDRYGRESKLRFCLYRFEEVWRRYRVHCCVAQGFTEAEFKAGSDDWPRGVDMKLVLKRSQFLECRPKNIVKATVRLCACPVCRDGFRIRSLMQAAAAKHRPDCSRCKDKDDDCFFGCPDFANTKVDEDDDKTLLGDLRDDVLAWDHHRAVVREQREEFERQREKVGRRGSDFDVLILLDFSPYQLRQDCELSMTEILDVFQCLHVVVHTKNDNWDPKKAACTDNRPYAWECFDFFAKESNDHHFVRRALFEVYSCIDLKNQRVAFWSDGGPFKTAKTLEMVLVQMKIQFRLKRCVWNFFASHHGKSQCDSHAANCKSRLKYLAFENDPIVGMPAVVEALQGLKRTQLFTFSYFDRQEPFDVEKCGEIKSMHFFEFKGKDAPVKPGSVHILTTKLFTSAEVTGNRTEDLKLTVRYYVDFNFDATSH